MIINHEIVDYKFWKPAHEESAAVKRNYGWDKGAVFSVDGDNNHIMVMENFATIERARAWSESTDFRAEMAVSGVKTNFAKSLNAELVP
jgi:hypothetical protein